MKMPRTSAFSTAIRSSNDLIHLEPVNYQCLTSVTVGLNYLYKNSRYGRTKHGRGKTDEKGKYHPCPGEILARRYKILQTLSKQGQSGIILKAQDLYSQTEVTIKVLHVKYYGIGIQEAHLLSTLKTADPYHVSRTVRLLATFKHKEHYCMVFESLHPEPITELPCLSGTTDVTQKLNYIRKLTVKLLQVLSFLQQQNMIHADLKPENILLKDKNDIDSIRVIDFGNAIHHVHQEVSMYYEKFELQTLLYRAPEVMFGIPFGCEVDMWSLGCILVELFLGTPLFLGENKTELIIEIVDVLGPLPTEIFQRGKFYKELSQYTSKHTIKDATLEILDQLTDCYDYTFANFLSGLLKLNPDERLTPLSALQHPFLAPEFNMGVLLQSQGSKDSLFVLKPENYSERPKISPDIKRQNPTSYDLLQLGTTSESCHNIAVVCPFSKSKQGRVSVVPQVSAIPPLNEIPRQRQAGSLIGSTPIVQSQRHSNQWNSADLRRNRLARSNINSRRTAVQEEELSASSPNRIFTDIQDQLQPRNLQTLANTEPLDGLQSNQSGSQSSYQLSDQTPSVSPTVEIYALSTERQTNSEGDLTTASPRKIRRVSGHRIRSDLRPQMPRVEIAGKIPAFTVSQTSSADNRPAQNTQVNSSGFEIVSQSNEIGVRRTRHDSATSLAINPRVETNSFESEDVIEVDPSSQAIVTTDPQSIVLINVSDDEEPRHHNVEVVPRVSSPVNHNRHINILHVRDVSRIAPVSPNLALDEENAHDVTILPESEYSDRLNLEFIDGRGIPCFDHSPTFLQQNHRTVNSFKDSTHRVLTSTPMTGFVRPSSKLIPEKRLSSSGNSINNELTSPLCSQECQESTGDSVKITNQQIHSVCSNKPTMRGDDHQQHFSNHQTSVQAPLCSLSRPIDESNNLSHSFHLDNNTTLNQSLQTDPNSSEFESIYSSLVQTNSKPYVDPEPSTSGETPTRTSSTLKRKNARSRTSSNDRTLQASEKSITKTSSSSVSCDPTISLIKEEPLDSDSSFQDLLPCSKIPFLSPLKQEIKQEPTEYEVKSNTQNIGEQDFQDSIHIKEEIVKNEHQETTSRSACSTDPEQKCLIMKVKSEIKLVPEIKCFNGGTPLESRSIKQEKQSPTLRIPPSPDSKYFDGGTLLESGGIKHKQGSPTSRIPLSPSKGSESTVKDDPAEFKVKLASPIGDNISPRLKLPSNRSRASSKALEPSFSVSHTLSTLNMGSSDCSVYQSTLTKNYVTKALAQTITSPSPSTLRVSQSPRRVSKPLESDEHSQIIRSPWISCKQAPAKVSGYSLRQFHPKLITTAHAFDSPFLPGREDSSSPESVVFSPKKLKRIENGTIYFEGFDKYKSKRELSEKVIKILPESKPKPQRVYSSTESDLSESTASYIRKNMKARRTQLPRRAHSTVLKQPRILRRQSTTTASPAQNLAGKNINRATSQYKEFVGSLAFNQENKGSQKQKPVKRNARNRAAIKRILKRMKLRKDFATVDSSAAEKHHSEQNPQISKVPEETHRAQRNEQGFNEVADIGIVHEEEDIFEEHTASPTDANVSTNLQEYSWNLLDRGTERRVVDEEWNQISRANNYFGSKTPVASKQVSKADRQSFEFEEAEVFDDVQTFEEKDDDDDPIMLYSPTQTPLISMTPYLTEASASPTDYETNRSDGISDDSNPDIDAIPCTPGVKAEIRKLLGQGFELRQISKPRYGTSNPRQCVNKLNSSVPYSPTQSPYVLTSTPDRSSLRTTIPSRRSKQRNIASSPSQPSLDSPKPGRRTKSISQRFVDSGVGLSSSPKVSFKFKKPKSCISNTKRRQLRPETSEPESVGYSDLSEVSSPEYNVSSGSSSFVQSSDPDVAYSPSQEPVITSSETIERKRKIRAKPKMRVRAINTSGTNRTDRHFGENNTNTHSGIYDDMDVEPDVLGTLGRTVSPESNERQWQKKLRKRDTIPRLDRSDPNVALYGAFVYSAKKLS